MLIASNNHITPTSGQVRHGYALLLSGELRRQFAPPKAMLSSLWATSKEARDVSLTDCTQLIASCAQRHALKMTIAAPREFISPGTLRSFWPRPA